MFESFSGKKTVNNIVLKLLNKKGALSVKEIHSLVKSELNVSYQSVHKAVKHLVDKKILIKDNKFYEINKDWFKGVISFIDEHNDNSVIIEGSRDLKKEGDMQTIYFDSLKSLEEYRKGLQKTYLGKSENKPPYCSKSFHLKSPLVYSEKSIKLLDSVNKTKTNCYLLVKGNTLIDKWCADYYRNEFVSIKNNFTFNDDYETYIMGDLVLHVYYPKTMMGQLERLYKRIKDVGGLNVPKMYRDLYEKKSEIKVVVYRNKNLAKMLRKDIIDSFNESIVLFDLDGTLTKTFQLINFTKFLISKKMFSKKNYTLMNKYVKDYQSGKMLYRELTDKFLGEYADGLKDKPVEEIRRLSKEYIMSNNFDPCDFTFELIKLMKKVGKIFVISGSPFHLVNAFCDYYKIDNVFATTLEAKNNKYTGKLRENLAIADNKRKMVRKIRFINKEKSFAFGDTKEDLSLFDAVGTPIFLNPNKEAKEHALNNSIVYLDSDHDIVREVKNLLKIRGLI